MRNLGNPPNICFSVLQKKYIHTGESRVTEFNFCLKEMHLYRYVISLCDLLSVSWLWQYKYYKLLSPHISCFRAKFAAWLPWQHCILPELLVLIQGQATQQVWERKGVWVHGGVCLCMYSSVCVCSRFRNSAKSSWRYSVTEVIIVVFCILIQVFKVMNLSCGFPLCQVTWSLQSSRSALAACHVLSVEHVLTSLSSGRPPHSFTLLSWHE